LRFLVDAQLPPALARHLRSLGHDAHHVADVGLIAAPDQMVWQRATDEDAALMSKDQDFLALALRATRGRFIWIRIGNTSRAAIIRSVGEALPHIIAAMSAGERIVEVRGRIDHDV
jgi:predicted nuclease of predicted toxin-antitoxin system